jgi:exodeoxyribonuclease-1
MLEEALSLIFYDTETTGTEKCFDQILQFAAIRTDDDLNELGRFEIRSRLAPHIVPSPVALSVTGISLEQLLDPSLPSQYEMTSAIRLELPGWCPSIFLAYNGHRFDEEFLRQAFWQCLHPPYLTNTGGSGRADVLKLMHAASFLYPGAIEIPFGDNGKPTFRLDRLAPANGFDHPNAHDALADVEAMIFLCRSVRERCPALWAALPRTAHKPAMTSFVMEQEVFLAVSGGTNPTGTFLTRIGENPNQSGQMYCLDLATDWGALAILEKDALAKRLVRSPKPIKIVKTNSAQVLIPLDEVPEHAWGDHTPEELLQLARTVRADHGAIERILAAMADGEITYEPSPHVEEQIYEGFPSRDDQRRMDAFHTAPWDERIGIAANFEDRRLRTLARRLIYAERPDLLADDVRREFEVALAKRMLGQSEAAGSWTTLDVALADAEKIIRGCGGDLASAIANVRDHLDARRAHCQSLVQGAAFTRTSS